MRRRPGRNRSIAFCALGALASSQAAASDTGDVSVKLEAEFISAVRLDDGETSLSRATFKPSLRWRNSEDWQGDLSARIELADDQTGLGTTETFSGLSRPLLRSDTSHLEIDKATLSYRGDELNITLGKQTVAWGILDGLQVTDRFDAVRRRDAVFTDPRPERIARWGARVKLTGDDLELDLAAMFDPSVNQLPNAQDSFAPRATRMRGGIAPGAAIPPLRVSGRDEVLNDATFGARLSREFSSTSISFVAISGPDTDPVFTLTTESGLPEVRLDYPRRTLLGGTVERSAGAQVWRGEFAIIPDQSVNTLSQTPLSSTDRIRVLAGVGLDWSAPNDVFVNAQIGVDHLDDGDDPLVRPLTDILATLRVQKSGLNERFWLRGEVITSLTDGDGTLRPWLDWRVTDTITVSAGADLIWGSKEGLLGQFQDQSRGWLRLRFAV